MAAGLASHERLDDIARAVGVDLITYLFEVGVAFVLLHYYKKFVDLQRRGPRGGLSSSRQQELTATVPFDGGLAPRRQRLADD